VPRDHPRACQDRDPDKDPHDAERSADETAAAEEQTSRLWPSRPGGAITSHRAPASAAASITEAPIEKSRHPREPSQGSSGGSYARATRATPLPCRQPCRGAECPAPRATVIVTAPPTSATNVTTKTCICGSICPTIPEAAAVATTRHPTGTLPRAARRGQGGAGASQPQPPPRRAPLNLRKLRLHRAPQSLRRFGSTRRRAAKSSAGPSRAVTRAAIEEARTRSRADSAMARQEEPP